MTPEQYRALAELFHKVMEQPEPEREGFAQQVCADAHTLNLLLKLVRSAASSQVTADTAIQQLETVDGYTPAFPPNEILLGRFRIVRFLGRGGMGEVYEAEDSETGRVALKTIRPELAQQPHALARFRHEVQCARKVTGTNVCRIFEFFSVPASCGRPAAAFLTMEFLEGVTLSDRIASGPLLLLTEAEKLAGEICRGLQTIHDAAIIHRDLKSRNIMLAVRKRGVEAVLMDFGLATEDTRALEAHSATLASASGPVAGTPEYMAPEQFEGAAVSAATDIYALGIILYELATGIHPYAAHSPFAAAIRRARQPRPASTIRPKIPRRWDRIIERCLQYEPQKRFQSASEVASALRSSPANLSDLRQDHTWILPSLALLVLGLTFWTVRDWWRSRQIYRPNSEALRFYNAGLSSLREGNYIKATRLLETALEQDSHYAMAHVRLAEAWTDLDFQANAQRELLLASPGENRLGTLDRLYFEAIQAVIVGDFTTAARVYSQILSRLPRDEKSAGYVDLGWAYERAGDPARALQDYGKASILDSHNPASFMHVAVLESRLHRVPEAQRAFDRAKDIFETELNQEGLAELDYQRGYAENDEGDSSDAKPLLENSLLEAQSIRSPQLQIRALTQLSAATLRYDPAAAEHYAQQAIRLAHDNRLDAWAANGLVRLALAQLRQGRSQEARASLQEGLQLARESQQLRVEALGNVALANLENQEHHPSQVIGPAQAAFHYYQKNGFFVPAANASILIIRTQRDNEQYPQALQASQAFLQLAARSGDRQLMWLSEELLGSVLLDMEHFPEALPHFLNAKRLADAPSAVGMEALNAAEAFWRLGRYREFNSMLQFVPAGSSFTVAVEVERAHALLSQEKYGEVLALTHQTLLKFPEIAATDRQELIAARAVAEAHLGLKARAREDLDSFLKEADAQDPASKYADGLVLAEVSLEAGRAADARQTAALAAEHFRETGQEDSALRSSCLAALAAKDQNDRLAAMAFEKKAVDIESEIEQNWGAQSARVYFSRPDLRTLLDAVRRETLGKGNDLCSASPGPPCSQQAR